MTARHPDWRPPDPNERRQLWARDLRRSLDAPLVFIRVGEAGALRPECREGRLICPLPDCEAPRITTRAGSKRDHFAHLSGGGHGPETLHHYTAKAVIGSWVRERHPEATVTVDMRTVESGRLPDVLVEFDRRRRFAFEIQYAGLTEAEWGRRHADYQRDGIVDIWLFGHTRRFLRPAHSDAFDKPEGRFTLGPLLETVDRVTGGIFWIDPDARQLVVRRRYSGAGHDSWAKNRIRPTVEIARVDLPLCRLEADHLWTPIEIDELAAKQIRDERVRQARRQEAEDRRREREELRREREARARAKAVRASARQAWSRYREKVVTSYGRVPQILFKPHSSERGILLEPTHWHALLVGSFVNRRIGKLFTSEEAAEFFSSRRLLAPGADAGDVVEDYLYVLRRYGFVEFAARGPFIESPILVLADCRQLPAEKEAYRRRVAIRNRSEEDELALAADLRRQHEEQQAT